MRLWAAAATANGIEQAQNANWRPSVCARALLTIFRCEHVCVPVRVWCDQPNDLAPTVVPHRSSTLWLVWLWSIAGIRSISFRIQHTTTVFNKTHEAAAGRRAVATVQMFWVTVASSSPISLFIYLIFFINCHRNFIIIHYFNPLLPNIIFQLIEIRDKTRKIFDFVENLYPDTPIRNFTDLSKHMSLTYTFNS